MAVWFYPGQEDYITKLNELGAIAEMLSGPDGWSPVLGVASDGERRVFQVTDWVGGETTKPDIGQYVGSTGFVTNIADAVNIRGPQGVDGDDGPPNVLSIGSVTEGTTADATITGTSPSQVLNLVLPQGPQGDPGVDGTDGVDGTAATIAVGTVTTGAPGTSVIVSNTGTSNAAVFDFTIPRGDAGAGSGDVVGPASSTNNAVALFDGTSGELLKDGGVLGTGAFVPEAKWAVDFVTVKYSTPTALVPNVAIGTYYPFSATVVTEGDTSAQGSTGNIYTMVSGSWVLTNPFDSDGVRFILTLTGDAGPNAYIRTGGVTTRQAVQQGSGSNIRYSEGTAGVDFTSFTLRQKLDQIGILANLNTTDKTSTVAAINEVLADIPAAQQQTDWTATTGITAIANKPAVIAAGSDAPAARAVIGAGTSNLADAPSDGEEYVRKDAAWVVATGGGGSALQVGDVQIGSSSPVTGTWLLCDGSIYLQSSYTALYTELGIIANSPGMITTPVARTMPSASNWGPVAYGNGVFVALTSNGTTNPGASTSPDGITWTNRTTSTGNQWQSIAFGNGVFVAVGLSGAATATQLCMTSSDGITWTQRNLSANTNWSSVAFGNGLFVAVSRTSGTIAATSPDGITWTARTLPATAQWWSVTFGNGVFVAVASGSTSAAVSPNGISWTSGTLSSSANWRSVAYGNGTFVALGLSSAIASTSSDGLSWTARTLPVASSWVNLAFGGGTFFATSSVNGTISATSSDGIVWISRILPATGSWQGVAFGSGVFVTVATTSTNAATAYAGVSYDPSTHFAVPRAISPDINSWVKAA